jgi:hypothetical protein
MSFDLQHTVHGELLGLRPLRREDFPIFTLSLQIRSFGNNIRAETATKQRCSKSFSVRPWHPVEH